MHPSLEGARKGIWDRQEQMVGWKIKFREAVS
jgi:hypothetical protein